MLFLDGKRRSCERNPHYQPPNDYDKRWRKINKQVPILTVGKVPILGPFRQRVSAHVGFAEWEQGLRAVEKARARASRKSEYDSNPEALKVREWRHKLQKTFLSSNKSVPKAEEMPGIDELFTTIESYDNMNIGYLTFSKIGKVMRYIHLLPAGDVPRDDEYKFRDRAKALVDSWHTILNANKGGEGEAAGGATESTARMDLNGTGEGDLTVMDVMMDEA
ncbi:hypothetical protein C8F04DRAFT_156398 [Mycena alexandri]|uniref:TFIIS N-terminal domain-containing protein n=1 Tax=Mycena alexandri TaxID=1745969 RepID=A0AAD6TCA1_9AGAR|nr:hypothetical protein C8F04DRAFT_156398 [Mycena alexandri]